MINELIGKQVEVKIANSSIFEGEYKGHDGTFVSIETTDCLLYLPINNILFVREPVDLTSAFFLGPLDRGED